MLALVCVLEVKFGASISLGFVIVDLATEDLQAAGESSLSGAGARERLHRLYAFKVNEDLDQ